MASSAHVSVIAVAKGYTDHTSDSARHLESIRHMSQIASLRLILPPTMLAYHPDRIVRGVSAAHAVRTGLQRETGRVATLAQALWCITHRWFILLVQAVYRCKRVPDGVVVEVALPVHYKCMLYSFMAQYIAQCIA